jgi:ribosome-binding factor A
MESKRQQKVNRLLQKELALLFQREGNAMFGNSLISVTGVRISPDLSMARVYLSIFGKMDKNEVMSVIKDKQKEIRRKAGEAMRHQLRIVPEFMFELDDSVDYAARIDELLKKKN